MILAIGRSVLVIDELMIGYDGLCISHDRVLLKRNLV